jgi:hypothetical protein
MLATSTLNLPIDGRIDLTTHSQRDVLIVGVVCPDEAVSAILRVHELRIGNQSQFDASAPVEGIALAALDTLLRRRPLRLSVGFDLTATLSTPRQRIVPMSVQLVWATRALVPVPRPRREVLDPNADAAALVEDLRLELRDEIVTLHSQVDALHDQIEELTALLVEKKP